MGKVILTVEQRAMLNGFGDKIEVYDEQGNLLGYLTPPDPGLDSLPVLSGPDPFSDEEIAEALRDTDPGRPLADILADLRRQYP